MSTQKIYRQAWMRSRTAAALVETDMWYVKFANSLLPILEGIDVYHTLSEREQLNLPLYLTWYLEDCVNDKGCWNRFIGLHQKYYGRYLPFYELSDSYVADEVNLEDIYYLLWTVESALTTENEEPGDPFAPRILESAPVIYERIERAFEEAPITGIDTLDWLEDMEGMLIEPRELLSAKPGEKYKPDVENFLAANEGKALMYCNDYPELRTFLLEKLYWTEDEPIMSHLREEREFVLMANPRGLMITPYVLPLFCDPDNPYYSSDKAKKTGSEMFYVPGFIPFDLIKYGETHHMFPEATFSFPDGKRILHENWDFIFRRYLTYFYEAD